MAAAAALVTVMLVGFWFAVRALWMLVAGPAPDEMTTHWRGVTLSMSSLGSSMATRFGIARIPGELRAIDLTSSPAAAVSGFLAILQYLLSLMLNWMPGL